MAATANEVLWRAGDDEARQLRAFWPRFEAMHGATLPDYNALHATSIEDTALFWQTLWDFADVRGTRGALTRAGTKLPGARWFPAARLNYADNLLQQDEHTIAIIARDENGARSQISAGELRRAVLETAAGLTAHGVGIGDRVAAVVPNRIETIIVALATAAIGAIWSSCSPDFGTRAIIDRFTQIEPRVLVACGGYHYAGRYFDCGEKIAEVRSELPTLRTMLWLDASPPHTAADTDPSLETLRTHGALRELPQFPFAQPLSILFSSGTTGLPKCITHSAGGTLLKHLCEQRLHCDFRPGERVLFFTTCGWMMWNWLVSALASGCTLCLYDGSPLHPDPSVLLRYASEERVQHFGISPGYLSQLAKLGMQPARTHDLSALRSVLSTGSPLAPDLFRWSYAELAPRARLSSITGGTDIMGCFAMGVPSLPVHAGEIQGPALGMDVAFVDDDALQVSDGEPGELICRQSFPSVPLGFWNDPDGSRFRAAYFDRFPGLWHHGDYGERTEHGGVIIHGRSDATLNRGGVRIGTAEIYRQLERFPEVLESLAVSHARANAELRIVLFMRLAAGAQLDEDLRARIRQQLRVGASPRHVPDLLIAVPDLPRTRSGKLTELAVREVIHGRSVKNIGALANPESLDAFKDLRELD